MPDRDEPSLPPTTGTSAGAASRAAAGWQPVGGALAASIVIHALAIASLAAMLVRPDAAPAAASESVMLTAVLTAGPSAESQRVNEPDARFSSVDAAVAVSTRSRPSAPLAGAASAPWSAMPVDVDPPRSLFGRSVQSEGVEWFESRNLARLGGDLEAKILRDFPVEPDEPVLLKATETIGYPIDALAAGVEGAVLVWFGVGEDGSVVDKEVLDGPPELASWVLERVDRLVDRPALVARRPVRGWVALEIHFSRVSAEVARERATAEQARSPAATAK